MKANTWIAVLLVALAVCLYAIFELWRTSVTQEGHIQQLHAQSDSLEQAIKQYADDTIRHAHLMDSLAGENAIRQRAIDSLFAHPEIIYRSSQVVYGWADTALVRYLLTERTDLYADPRQQP